MNPFEKFIQKASGLNPVGRVGGLFNKPIGRFSSWGALVDTGYKGATQQTRLGGLFTPEGAAYNVVRNATGGPFSLLPQVVSGLQELPYGSRTLGLATNSLANEIKYGGSKIANESNYIIDRLKLGNLPYGEVDRRINTGDYGRNAPPGSGKFFGTMTYSPEGSLDNAPARERAYAAELSSTAQQAAQNPMLNQYRSLSKTDPTAALNLGMQMWAQANPGLAQKVKPGQSGYEAIQPAIDNYYTNQYRDYGEPASTPITPPGPTEEEIQAYYKNQYRDYGEPIFNPAEMLNYKK